MNVDEMVCPAGELQNDQAPNNMTIFGGVNVGGKLESNETEELESAIEPPNPKRRVPPKTFFNITVFKCKLIGQIKSKSGYQTSSYYYQDLKSTARP